MKCEEFEDRLNRVLDEDRRPEWDPELRLHVENCPQCRELAGIYGRLFDGFYALTTPEAPADLAVRVVDAMHARPAVTRRVSLVTAALATAAAVLVALLPMIRTADERAEQADLKSSQPALASAAMPWQEIDRVPVVGPVLQSLSDDDDKTNPYVELAKGTGQGLASVVLYIPGVGNGPGGMATDVINGEPAWPTRMNQSLRPVTDSVSETLDLLLRTLPNSASSRRS